MRNAGALCVVAAVACHGAPALPCDAGTSAPRPEEILRPDPACAPLFADEVDAMDTPCPWWVSCRLFHPWHITILDERGVAYLDYLYIGTFEDSDGVYVDCPLALRYRLDLADGTLGLIGHRCIAESEGELVLAAVEARRVEHGHLCAISERFGVEVRILDSRVPHFNDDIVYFARLSLAASVVIRDHESGGVRFQRRILVPANQTQPTYERHVQSTLDPRVCCDRPDEMGCGVQCGGQPAIAACVRRLRLVDGDGFCHEHPAP